MATNTTPDSIQLRVIIDGSPARKELAEVNQSLVKLKETQKALREEQSKLNAERMAAAVSGDTKAVQELNKALAENRTQTRQNTEAIAAHTTKQQALREQIGATGLSFNELRGQATALQAALNRAVPNTPEARELAADLIKLRERMKEVGGQAGMQAQAWEHLRKGLKVSDMSMRELRLEQTRLKETMDKSRPSSAGYAQLRNELDAVDARMRRLRTGMGPFGQAWAAVKGQIAGATAVLGTFLAGSALINQTRNIIDSSAQLSDAMADVQRTTFMTNEEVRQMISEFKKLNTRTPRQELMDLAYDAGKLGIQGRDSVMEFVKAGDQLRVALGRDLGDDAVKNIGKLVDIFRLKEQFGLEQSLLKVGSTINELGIASTAAEGYMVEFMKRLGGVAPLAGITIDQTLALGATLDSLGQTSEVSSTALSKMFLKMAQDAEAYARIAGVSVEDFSRAMNENALDAFIMVLEAAGKTEGGIIELSETLGDIGVDGSRAAGVFGVLANNTDKLRAQMQIANKAFEEGVSVTKEFELKNETLAAQLAKLRKEIYQTFITPGLMDTVQGWVASLRDLLEWIRRNSDTIKFYGKAIMALIATMAAYRLGMMATLAIEKISLGYKAALRTSTLAWAAAKALLTGNITRASAAMRMLNITMASNPIGLVLAGITALVSAFFLFGKEVSQAAKSAAQQQTALADLEKQILRTNVGTKERTELIQQLKDQHPELLKNINAETASNHELSKALREVNDEIIARMLLAEKEERIVAQRERAAEAGVDAKRLELQAMDAIASRALKYNIDVEQIRAGGADLLTQLDRLNQEILTRGNARNARQVQMDRDLLQHFKTHIQRLGADYKDEMKVVEELEADMEKARANLRATAAPTTEPVAKQARTLIEINKEIRELQATLNNPKAQEEIEPGVIHARIDALSKERDAMAAVADENLNTARTLAVINEEIKKLKEQQEQTSTSRAEYQAIEEKIKALEKEKVAIEGVKNTGTKAREKAVEDLTAHEQAIKDFHERMLQDTMAEDERALRQLDVRHAEELTKLQEHQKKLVAAKMMTPEQAATNVDTLGEAQARERIALIEQQGEARWKALKEANDKIQQQLGEHHNKQLQMEVEHWEAIVAAQAEGGGKSRNRDGVTRMWGAGPNIEDIKKLHTARLALYEQNAKDLVTQEAASWDEIILEAKQRLQEYEDAMAATGLPYSDEVQAELQTQHQAIVDLEAKKNQAIENINRAHRDKERAERQKESLAIRQEYARRVQSVANWASAMGNIMASMLQVRDAEIAAAEQRADADGERTAAEIAGIEELKEARKRAALTHIKVQMAAALASGVASVMASPIPFPGNLLAAAGAIATIIGLFAQAKSLLNDSGASAPGQQRPGGSEGLTGIPLGAKGLAAQNDKVFTAKDGGGVLGGSRHGQGNANLLIDSNTGQPLAEVERDELMLIMSRKATAANADLIPTLLEASRRGERIHMLSRELPMPNPTKVGQAMRVVHMAGGGVATSKGEGLNGSFNLVEKSIGSGTSDTVAAQMLSIFAQLLEETRATRRAAESFPTELQATSSIIDFERRRTEYDRLRNINQGRPKTA